MAEIIIGERVINKRGEIGFFVSFDDEFLFNNKNNKEKSQVYMNYKKVLKLSIGYEKTKYGIVY